MLWNPRDLFIWLRVLWVYSLSFSFLFLYLFLFLVRCARLLLFLSVIVLFYFYLLSFVWILRKRMRVFFVCFLFRFIKKSFTFVRFFRFWMCGFICKSMWKKLGWPPENLFAKCWPFPVFIINKSRELLYAKYLCRQSKIKFPKI